MVSYRRTMEDCAAADSPPTTSGIDETSLFFGQTNKGDDILPKEESSFKSDIENDGPNEDAKCTELSEKMVDSDRALPQESPKRPKNVDPLDDTGSLFTINSALTGEKDSISSRSQMKKLALRDGALKSPLRRKKHSDLLQMKDVPVFEDPNDGPNDASAGILREKSPKRRDKKKHLDLDSKSPRRIDSVSPKPKSRTPKAVSKNHENEDEKWPMLLQMDDDDVNDLFSLTSKLLAGQVPETTSVGQSFPSDANGPTQEERETQQTSNRESLSSSLDYSKEESTPSFVSDAYFNERNSILVSKCVRRRRSNSLPPKESRATVVLPNSVQTPLRRSQKKKVWVDLTDSFSPKKQHRRIRTKASEVTGLIVKSPRRDRKNKEDGCDSPSKSSRRKSEELDSNIPTKTPERGKRPSLVKSTQNEEWSLTLPLDDDDFDGSPSKIPISDDKQQNSLVSSLPNSNGLELIPQTSNIEEVSETVEITNVSAGQRSPPELPPNEALDANVFTEQSTEPNATELIATKNESESKDEDFVDEEVEILDLSVDASSEALQMSAVVASMDAGMAKVWARFDDQMHRSMRCDDHFVDDFGKEELLSLGTKDADQNDQTIVALTNYSPANDTASTDKQETDGSGPAILLPSDPPSSSDSEEAISSENGLATTAMPVLYSPDDSRLSRLQKALVVDLWSDDDKSVVIALNELLELNLKTTTELLQQGGHLALIVLLRKWRTSTNIQTLMFTIIQRAAEFSTEFADAIVGLGALDVILSSVRHFVEDEELASAGCGALLNLTLPANHAKVFVFELNGIQAVASASGRFPSNVSLQKYTLWMIQYFSYWDDFKVPIVQAGGMQALAKIIESFSHKSHDVAAMETILKSARATMKRLL